MIDIKEYKVPLSAKDYYKIQEYIEQIMIELGLLEYNLVDKLDDDVESAELIDDIRTYLTWIGYKFNCWEDIHGYSDL